MVNSSSTAHGNPSPPALLFVDDEEMSLTVARMLFGKDYRVLTALSGPKALEVLEREDVQVVLTDERMPEMRGIELLSRIAERWPDTGRVIVSAYADADRLLAAINRGHAFEYVTKPYNPDELRACVERVLATVQHRRQLVARAEMVDALSRDLEERVSPGELVGKSPALQAVLESARRAAQSDATVLIRGETGTGKELVARLIHRESARAQGPFIRVNCGALTEELLGSELFGHEQGAFTGAVKTRKGRFELAHGGTLFLDEVGDVSPKLQVSLLRVLQERELERVGGNRTIPVDVRVVAATHQDLEQQVREGRFRQDLYYRLNVVPLLVPPLRERMEDLEGLIHHFLRKYARGSTPAVSPDALAALSTYSWPGNIRELENLVQRALVLSRGGELQVQDFCLQLGPVPASSKTDERERIMRVMAECGGNQSRAAKLLGISRNTLIARLSAYGVVRPRSPKS